MRVLVTVVAAVAVTMSALVMVPPNVTVADHCAPEMPRRVSLAMGNLFEGRYIGLRQVDGRGPREHVFAVGRVMANGGEWDAAGRLWLAPGRRLAMTRDACAPILGLIAGARYVVSTSYLGRLSSQDAVAWRLASNGAVDLQRQYASNDMDPRLAGPATVRDAVRLMRPVLDGVGSTGVSPVAAASALRIPCTGTARLVPPEEEAPDVPAPAPRLHPTWIRIAPAPFGAEYGIAAWRPGPDRDRLIVIDPATGRTAAWDALTGLWQRRRTAPFDFDLNSRTAWDGERLFLLADHLGEHIPVAYDAGSDEWLPMAPAPIGPAVAAVWTGASLIAATYDGTAAAYDPDADCWRALPPIEGAGSVNALVWTGERLLADTRTPIEAPRGTEPVTVLAELDLVTLTWRDAPAAPSRIGHSVEPVAVDGQIVYWSGDVVGSDTTNQAFDPRTGAWDPLTWTCPSVGPEPVLVGRILVSADGRGMLDPATGACRRLPAPPRPQASGRPILGRAAIVATDGALIAWSGTTTEDGPPVRDGSILRLGPR